MSMVPRPAGTSGSTDPLVNAFVITPSDDDELALVPATITVSAFAVVKMDLVGGTTGISIPCAAGIPLPWRPTKIYATGTDNVTIIGGY
jgi:hypothetical protein